MGSGSGFGKKGMGMVTSPFQLCTQHWTMCNSVKRNKASHTAPIVKNWANLPGLLL